MRCRIHTRSPRAFGSANPYSHPASMSANTKMVCSAARLRSPCPEPDAAAAEAVAVAVTATAAAARAA